MSNRNSAAAKLLGMSLQNGWKVVAERKLSANQTGGNFSHGYRVENEGRIGFLKAFDFSDAFNSADPDRILQNVQLFTSCFQHERDILFHCKNRRLSKVVLPIDQGSVVVPNFSQLEGRVWYLIFDMADGDIRTQVDNTRRLDTLWSVGALRDICLGLSQVHKEMIAHQDLKPSNVLVFRQAKDFRVADFGRSSKIGINGPFDSQNFPGDQNYSPPEFRYGHAEPDFIKRRIAGDLFMLGNIASFIFCGINITSHMFVNLPKQFHPNAWRSTYYDVLPYLNTAHTSTMEQIEVQIDEIVRAEITLLIRELCAPDLRFRDHRRGIGKNDQYSLQRYVSELDLLFNRAKLRLRIKKAS
jgi:eukaryotic-like serine/threonine-protein kinase